jgi:hypothetical protein
VPLPVAFFADDEVDPAIGSVILRSAWENFLRRFQAQHPLAGLLPATQQAIDIRNENAERWARGLLRMGLLIRSEMRASFGSRSSGSAEPANHHSHRPMAARLRSLLLPTQSSNDPSHASRRKKSASVGLGAKSMPRNCQE